MEISENEFSRVIVLKEQADGTKRTIEANAEECIALCERFELEKISQLKGEYTITTIDERGGGYELSLEISYDIHDEESENHKEREEFVMRVFEENKEEEDDDMELDIEYCVDDKLDLGEIIAQLSYLSVLYADMDEEEIDAFIKSVEASEK
jgi:hypothetical protein